MILAGDFAGRDELAAVPHRGRGRRPPAAPEHRPDLRGRRARRAGAGRTSPWSTSTAAASPHAWPARPLPPRQAAALARDRWPGPSTHAHEQRIVHRDLKPANILLTDRRPAQGHRLRPGQAARRRRPARRASGAILGTPELHGPRAGRRASRRRSAPAADVYALGAILYECSPAGRRSRRATALDTLAAGAARRSRCRPRRLQPRCPRDLETICLKCLEKEPGQPLRLGRGAGRRPGPLPATRGRSRPRPVSAAAAAGPVVRRNPRRRRGRWRHRPVADRRGGRLQPRGAAPSGWPPRPTARGAAERRRAVSGEHGGHGHGAASLERRRRPGGRWRPPRRNTAGWEWLHFNSQLLDDLRAGRPAPARARRRRHLPARRRPHGPALAFSPDGTRIAAASAGNPARSALGQRNRPGSRRPSRPGP